MSSYLPPKSECKRLAEWDSRLRFALSMQPREWGGGKLFVVQFLSVQEVGNSDNRQKMYTLASEAWGFGGIFSSEGVLGDSTDFPQGVPVIYQWCDLGPGEDMCAVMTGDFVSKKIYRSRPVWQWESDDYQHALSAGKDFSNYMKDGSAELGSVLRHAYRTDTGATRFVKTKEDIKEELKLDENRKFRKYLDGGDGGYENYFVNKYGLRKPEVPR